MREWSLALGPKIIFTFFNNNGEHTKPKTSMVIKSSILQFFYNLVVNVKSFICISAIAPVAK
jgi:hypothetical protein